MSDNAPPEQRSEHYSIPPVPSQQRPGLRAPNIGEGASTVVPSIDYPALGATIAQARHLLRQCRSHEEARADPAWPGDALARWEAISTGEVMIELRTLLGWPLPQPQAEPQISQATARALLWAISEDIKANAQSEMIRRMRARGILMKAIAQAYSELGQDGGGNG